MALRWLNKEAIDFNNEKGLDFINQLMLAGGNVEIDGDKRALRIPSDKDKVIFLPLEFELFK